MEPVAKLHNEGLRMLRERRGWSQRELARRCGFSDTQIRKYEMGTMDPSASNLGVMAKIFEVSADYLLGFTDLPEVKSSPEGLSNIESSIIDEFRREGWPGVFRLGADQMEHVVK